MRALVTGGTGFIGSHLVERLLAGGLKVVCLVRPTSDTRWIGHLRVELRVGSLAEPQALRAAMAGVEYVFHVAGVTRARTRRQYMAANAEGTRRLVDAAIGPGTAVRRLVYVSSLAAVGPTPGTTPLDETAEPHPIDAYGASKLAGERAVLAAADRVPVTIVRPPGVYGPRDRNFLPLFRQARRFRLAPVVGSPRNEATLAHVSDLAEGIYLAARAPVAAGRTYFIASGVHSFADMLDALAFGLGLRLRRVRVPGPLAVLAGELGELKWLLTGRSQILCRRKVRDLLQPRWTCSWQRARDELGYRPRVALPDGMRQTAEWYTRHGWLEAKGAKVKGTGH